MFRDEFELAIAHYQDRSSVQAIAHPSRRSPIIRRKSTAETRFLVFTRSGGVPMPVEKPGFFNDLGGKTKILAETRFLVGSRSAPAIAGE
ncbi:MAG: hypothetical protein EBE86_007185 [Hormoscilla sp. GUM202]|nr:hypothetical protein [Hormoscilla sp. GUM202]